MQEIIQSTRAQVRDHRDDILRLLKHPQPDLPTIAEQLGLPEYVAQKHLRCLFYDGLVHHHDGVYKLTLAGWSKVLQGDKRNEQEATKVWMLSVVKEEKEALDAYVATAQAGAQASAQAAATAEVRWRNKSRRARNTPVLAIRSPRPKTQVEVVKEWTQTKWAEEMWRRQSRLRQKRL
jgi:predicted ArsR family transcriptional regulator